MSWKRNWNDTPAQSTHSIRDAKSSFTIEGVDFARDIAQVGVGLSAKLNNNVTFDVGYEGKFGHEFKEHSVTAQFKIKF